jgi:hypothetical protein
VAKTAWTLPSEPLITDFPSLQDVMMFLKKRAALEEEYGKQMTKLAQSMSESFEKAHPKAG